MARFPELATLDTIKAVPVVSSNRGWHHRGRILEDPDSRGIAVRTDCNRNPNSCPERNNGSVCWDPVSVMDPYGNPTVYNFRTVFCRGSEEGRELIQAFKRQTAEAKIRLRSL